MKKKLLAIILLLCLSTLVNSNPSLTGIHRDEIISEEGGQALNNINENLFRALTSLEKLVKDNFSIFSETADSHFFYGLSSGIAGIALDLLEAIDFSHSYLETPEQYDTRALVLVEKIANILIKNTVVNNETHTYWQLNKNNSYIDLGYDFGNSGILSFFSKLALKSDNRTYTDISTRILRSIIDLSNTANNQIKWSTNLTEVVTNVSWYSLGNIIPRYSLDRQPPSIHSYANYTFLGKSFGPAGLGLSVIDYHKAPNANHSLTDLIFKKINNLFENLTTSELGYDWIVPVAIETPSVFANSFANGLSGIGTYFMRLGIETNNTNGLLISKKILKGMLTEENYKSTVFNNSVEITSNYEVGREIGIAGHLKFLVEAQTNGLVNSTQISSIVDLADIISNYSYTAGNSKIFFERSNSINESLGFSSLSNYYGTAGILRVLFEYEELNGKNEYIDSFPFFSKAFLGSLFAITSDYLVLADVLEGGFTASFNSAVGISGVLIYLLGSHNAELTFSTNEISFQNVLLGSSIAEGISIKNEGLLAGNISLSSIPLGFSVNLTHYYIQPNETITIVVNFLPTEEIDYSGILHLLVSGNLPVSIKLSGIAFTKPVIEHLSFVNNSSVQDSVLLSFNITANRGIDIVNLTIYRGEVKILSVFPSLSSPDIYQFEFDTLSVENAVYIIQVAVTDIAGRTVTSNYILTVNNSISNEGSSLNQLYIALIILGASTLFFIFYIFVRKYNSRNKEDDAFAGKKVF